MAKKNNNNNNSAARPTNASPYNANPYNANSYNANPYNANPYNANAYRTNPYGANAYNANAYNQNAYRPASNKPNYVMRKSAWSVIRPWHILLFFLVIPLLIMIWKIINVKDETISFYNNRVVEKSGILAKNEKTTVLTRMLSVSIHQTFWGRIFNYGDIQVDVVGKWDVNMKGIKKPKKAKKFLETIAMDGMRMRPIIMD